MLVIISIKSNQIVKLKNSTIHKWLTDNMEILEAHADPLACHGGRDDVGDGDDGRRLLDAHALQIQYDGRQ